MSTTDGWLKLNFTSCVVRKTRSLGALVLCFICNMVFVNYIYDIVVLIINLGHVIRYPAGHRSNSTSHPDYFARTWTNADHLETDSSHPHVRTYIRPTHRITHHYQRYTEVEQQRYVQQRLSTLIHAIVFAKGFFHFQYMAFFAQFRFILFNM